MFVSLFFLTNFDPTRSGMNRGHDVTIWSGDFHAIRKTIIPLTLLHPDLWHWTIGLFQSAFSKKTWMVSEAANNDQMKLSILGSLKNSKKKHNRNCHWDPPSRHCTIPFRDFQMGEFHSSAISAMAFSHSEIVLPMNVHNVASIIRFWSKKQVGILQVHRTLLCFPRFQMVSIPSGWEQN